MNEKLKQKHTLVTTSDNFKLAFQLKMMNVLQQEVLVCGTYI
jgi:hypothetical protein